MSVYEENLRGELSLAQLRELQAFTWPGLQGDLERRSVRDVGEVEVVPIADSLGPQGSAYGVRLSPLVDPAPVAPLLCALPGRYRAWVLPTCGVAVALEPLDSDDVYLHDHRAHLFELQEVSDADLLPLDAAPGFDVLRGHSRTVVEGTLTKKDDRKGDVLLGDERVAAPGLLFARLVVGVRYRARPPKRNALRVFEPIIDDLRRGTGPYR